MTIERLKELGANTDEGLARCGGKEEFYLKLVSMALAGDKFEELEKQIINKNYAEAFELAHALKGVLANLSLTPLYQPVSEITEGLRAGEDRDYSEFVTKMKDARKAFTDEN